MKTSFILLGIILTLFKACLCPSGNPPEPKVYLIPSEAKIGIIDTNCRIEAIDFEVFDSIYIFPYYSTDTTFQEDSIFTSYFVHIAFGEEDYLSNCSLFDLDTSKLTTRLTKDKKDIAQLHKLHGTQVKYCINRVYVKCKEERRTISLRIHKKSERYPFLLKGNNLDTLYFNHFRWECQD